MTRATLLLLAATLAGCAAAPPAMAPRAIDAADWLARARPVALESVADADLDDQRISQAYALATELDAAVGWVRACDTYWNPETQRLVTEDASAGYTRGLFMLHDIGPAEAIVAVTCDFGAYQGSYALVHVAGPRAALLVGMQVSETGAPFGPPVPVYATPAFDAGAHSFTTLGVSRGLGDCGVRASYDVSGFGTATLVEARGRACDDRPGDAPPPEDWPVVYPR